MKLREMKADDWATYEWIEVTTQGQADREFVKGKLRTPDEVVQAIKDWDIAQPYYIVAAA